ncbi:MULTISPECIES: hypothetical protein [Marinomonas]|uniref:DUF3630 family protein n=1 Tax=Marinomonas arctica TaxID=383750 RepID=A0A7H1J954_9GAMM|nr:MULTISPECIES: hypothetical protein [Marinomonas]MCS7487305.1 hypothetical protein [Marinomonas sp. BSi20414]QNT07020.1 hypothetical protein IBG28_05120 [Marinomonas arctica]GGN35344.1 hypothetical protein GCM10011350_32430 [Marinomonas arctica]
MQTDIEVYVLSCPTENIITWLEASFTLVKKSTSGPLCSKLTLLWQGNEVEVTILEQAAGKRFTSIWFDSDKTPWEDDITCAKQVFKALDCEVRCNFQGWEEEGNQDPDLWWRINHHGEGPFIWN